MNCAECLESWDCVRSGDVASGAMCTGVLLCGYSARRTRGAHPKHGKHCRDFGRVEIQRLVIGRRRLPSRKEGIRRCEIRAGR